MASKITLPSVHVNAPSNEVVVGVVVAVVVVGVVVVVCVVVCDLYRAPWWQRHARCERASAYNAQRGAQMHHRMQRQQTVYKNRNAGFFGGRVLKFLRGRRRRDCCFLARAEGAVGVQPDCQVQRC